MKKFRVFSIRLKNFNICYYLLLKSIRLAQTAILANAHCERQQPGKRQSLILWARRAFFGLRFGCV
jgi:hypothetical protein